MSVLLKAMKRAAAEQGRAGGQASSVFKDTGANPVYGKKAPDGRKSLVGFLLVLLFMAGIFLGALALMSGTFERRVRNAAADRPVVAVALAQPEQGAGPVSGVEANAPVADESPDIAPIVVELPEVRSSRNQSFIYVHPMQQGPGRAGMPAPKVAAPAAPVKGPDPVMASTTDTAPAPVVAAPSASPVSVDIPVPVAETPAPVVAQPPVPVSAPKVQEAVMVDEPAVASMPDASLEFVPAGVVSGMAGALREPAWSKAQFDADIPPDIQGRLSWAADLVRKKEISQAMSLYDGLRAVYPDQTEIDVAQLLALRRFMPDSPEVSMLSVRLEQVARGVAMGMVQDKTLRKPGRVLISRFMDAHPDAALVASQAGAILVEKGDAEDGVALLEQAQTLTPADGLHAYNLGVALARAGKTEAARQMFGRALETSDGADLPLPVDAIKAWLAAHP